MTNRAHFSIRNGKKKAAVGDAALLERRILILAPTGNDAGLTAGFLHKANLVSQICPNVDQLAREVKSGCGTLVLAEEILTEQSVSLLIQALAEQPTWSDVPIILITSGGEVSQTHLRQFAVFGPGGNVTVLERPFRPNTLLSALEVALRSRQRQYEARDSVVQLKRAHDEVQAASRAKDSFLAALSHELRTPLNPVLLVASENAANAALPESVRADFEMIRKNIELEARLIDDLLDLTRISRGKLSLDKQEHDLHDILRDALSTIDAEARQKKLSVKVELAATQTVVLGDSVRLQQIFWNVLKNAVKFTPVGGSITVKTRTLEGHGKTIIKVTDSGIGMTTQEMAHIFTAFSQGDHAEGGGSHRFGGLGLGLAISRMLVKLHAGVIYAASAGRNRGSTFSIEFPFIAQKKPAAAPDNAAPQDGHASAAVDRKGGLRILLVEDHEPTRLALANLLKRREYDVSCASCVSEARALAESNHFDLVVSDIGLPDQTGYELMSELRDRFGLKGIALTGYGMEKDVLRGQEAGFMAHLIKPVRIEALEHVLAEFSPVPA